MVDCRKLHQDMSGKSDGDAHAPGKIRSHQDCMKTAPTAVKFMPSRDFVPQMPGAGGGSVITSGNREDIGRLGGLEGDNVLIYTGDYRDMSGSGKHTVPMQSRFHCEVRFSLVTACLHRTLVRILTPVFPLAGGYAGYVHSEPDGNMLSHGPIGSSIRSPQVR
jgi:hypothetical protein